MTYNRKANIAIILLILGVIVAFAYSYNSSVKASVNSAARQDREVLQEYNKKIIDVLCNCESSEQWDSAIEEFQDVVIVVNDAAGQIIARSLDKSWTTLDVKVQTPFEYHGRAYLLTSSVYLLRNYNSASSNTVLRFILIEALIGIAALSLLIFIIYTCMLRPYHKLYNLIESYEKTGVLKEVQFRGNIGKVYQRFVMMTRHIERQQTNQQRIIASISHDIKTPLTSILGYAERLQKDNLPQERKIHYLKTVYQKAQEVQNLIDEFDEYLSFNMLKETTLEAVTIEEFKQALLINYESDLELNKVKFLVNKNCENCTIMIDKARIYRVFGNIFSNSLKHFKGDEKIIVVNLSADKDKVYINISDNGTGVDPERLEIIFEPLYTSDEGRKVAGLGLAICKEIIDAHKGVIYAKNSEMGGLEICIELNRVK